MTQALLLLPNNSVAGLLLMLNVGCREPEDLFPTLRRVLPKETSYFHVEVRKDCSKASRHHTRLGTKCPKEGHLI